MGDPQMLMMAQMMGVGQNDPQSETQKVAAHHGLDPDDLNSDDVVDHLQETQNRIDNYLAKQWLLGKRKLTVSVNYGNIPLEYQYLQQYHGMPNPLSGTPLGSRFGMPGPAQATYPSRFNTLQQHVPGPPQGQFGQQQSQFGPPSPYGQPPHGHGPPPHGHGPPPYGPPPHGHGPPPHGPHSHGGPPPQWSHDHSPFTQIPPGTPHVPPPDSYARPIQTDDAAYTPPSSPDSPSTPPGEPTADGVADHTHLPPSAPDWFNQPPPHQHGPPPPPHQHGPPPPHAHGPQYHGYGGPPQYSGPQYGGPQYGGPSQQYGPPQQYGPIQFGQQQFGGPQFGQQGPQFSQQHGLQGPSQYGPIQFSPPAFPSSANPMFGPGMQPPIPGQTSYNYAPQGPIGSIPGSGHLHTNVNYGTSPSQNFGTMPPYPGGWGK